MAVSALVAIDPVGDDLVARISERVAGLRVGPGTDDRSEMLVRLYFFAVACVTATSLESVNGVGGNAVIDSFVKSDLTCS